VNQKQARQQRSPTSAKQLLEVLKRHVHSVFLSSLLLAILGIVGVSLLPNVYRATTTILVDPQKIPERYVSSTVTSDPSVRMNTLSQQVLSSSRLQEIIDKDNLYPKLREKKSREEVLDFMRDKTKIELKQSPEPEQGLSSFSISYEDSNRMLVALIANQLASSFIDWNLKARQQQALGTTEFLSNELQQAKRSLEEQEAQLEAFRVRHAGGTPQELNGNLQALSRLQSEIQSNADAISRLDQERILMIQVKPAELRDTIPLTERDRLLQEKRRLENERWSLKRQFTETYPDVIVVTEQLRDLNARLAALPEPPPDAVDSSDLNTKVRLTLIDKELQRHKQQQANLQQQIRSFQGKVDSVPALETQLAELTRNYEASKQNYQTLLDKTFSAGMSEELERKQQAARFTVLDPAKVPEKPIKPRRIKIMAGVLLTAFLIPAGTTIALHLLSGSIKSEAEVREMLPLKIPILGTIPPITSKADLHRGRLVTVQILVVSVIACTALVIFLLKVRPIL
jgi:succinoglycan biosynthesis transport protein ExoP